MKKMTKKELLKRRKLTINPNSAAARRFFAKMRAETRKERRGGIQRMTCPHCGKPQPRKLFSRCSFCSKPIAPQKYA